MTQPAPTVLLLTMNAAMTHTLQKVLMTNGYGVTVAATLAQAQIALRQAKPNIALIDRDVIRQEKIRRDQLSETIPIIALQAFDQPCDEEDCLCELDGGFDLAFCSASYRELLAHIRSILRRHNMTKTPSSVLHVAGLMMDTARHEVRVGRALVELTPKEFRILHQFLLSPGVVLSRQDLLNRVWGEDYALEEHALDVHIHSLRQKIEANSAKPTFIVTIRGIGYKLQHA